MGAALSQGDGSDREGQQHRNQLLGLQAQHQRLLLKSQEILALSPGYDSAHAYVTCVTFCQQPECTCVATMGVGELLYDWIKFKS
jgi:hypothetical protein